MPATLLILYLTMQPTGALSKSTWLRRAGRRQLSPRGLLGENKRLTEAACGGEHAAGNLAAVCHQQLADSRHCAAPSSLLSPLLPPAAAVARELLTGRGLGEEGLSWVETLLHAAALRCWAPAAADAPALAGAHTVRFQEGDHPRQCCRATIRPPEQLRHAQCGATTGPKLVGPLPLTSLANCPAVLCWPENRDSPPGCQGLLSTVSAAHQSEPYRSSVASPQSG